MKVLYDTNVILDVFLKRSGLSEASGKAVSRAETKRVDGFVCANSVTTIYYWAEKVINGAAADTAVKMVTQIMKVTSVDGAIIQKVIKEDYVDFEDEVIYQSAIAAGIDCIITRDKRGFKKAIGLKVLTPEQFLAIGG